MTKAEQRHAFTGDAVWAWCVGEWMKGWTGVDGEVELGGGGRGGKAEGRHHRWAGDGWMGESELQWVQVGSLRHQWLLQRSRAVAVTDSQHID